MRQRIFLAINLPKNVKEELVKHQAAWPELPCRWVKEENLHITLDFLGYLTDEELVQICQKTEETALEKKPFTVKLNKICYGPLGKPPRMVWAIGEKINQFNILPHITLGRIRQWDFKKMDPEEKPKINQDISLNFNVSSIEIMESRLKRGGPKYTIVQSCPLKN